MYSHRYYIYIRRAQRCSGLQVEDIGVSEPDSDEVLVKLTLRPILPSDLSVATGLYASLKDKLPMVCGEMPSKLRDMNRHFHIITSTARLHSYAQHRDALHRYACVSSICI